MYKAMLLLLTAAMTLAAGCGSSGNDGPPQVGTAQCSNDAQKQFVLDVMRDVYFWNASLPATVDLASFDSPEALLEHLKSFSPISPVTDLPVDTFSFINSAAEDAAFFGEGQFEGFGFSFRSDPAAADDIRFTRVFSGSPAALAGFARGHRIMALDGRSIAEIEAAEGVGAVFDQSPLEFTIRPLVGNDFTVTVTKAVVTIDPLPQWRVIDVAGGTSVGYIEFATFISTADPAFDTIFAAFRQASVTDVIVDMRYNGGGLVSTAELLGDYLGGAIADTFVFSRTFFNANNSASNRTAFFSRLVNSMSLSRLVVIATRGTASASELVTNSMEPYVEVAIVGDTTFGKPVGQVGIEFCEKILRPTAFQTVNALDEGDYFDGLPVDCPAADVLAIPVGADSDPNVVGALSYLATGACPIIAVSQQQKLAVAEQAPAIGLRGSASRQYGGVF